MRTMDLSKEKIVSLIDILIAALGQTATQRPQPLHSWPITARPLINLIASTKQTPLVQLPHPLHLFVTFTSTPGIFVTLELMLWERCGSIFQRQQQGQQLQIERSLFPGLTSSHIASSLLRPIMWISPASRQRRTCSKASCLVTGRPSRGSIFMAA
jgi:hypothetical protein